MKRCPGVLIVASLVLTAVILSSCSEGQSTPTKPTVQVPQANSPVQAVEAREPLTDESPVVVVGDSVVKGGEFRQRVLMAMAPSREDMVPNLEPVDLVEVARTLAAEKVMVLEAREKGTLNDFNLAREIARFRRNLLVNNLVQSVLKDKDLSVPEEEIDQAMQKSATAERPYVEARLKNLKVQQIMQDYLRQLTEQLHVRKHPETFARVAAANRRLLEHPKMERPKNTPWIQLAQIQTELDPNEANLVLVEYDGGRFTAMDWFLALHEVVPVRRPANLSMPDGVEQFLDNALQRPLMVTQACNVGLDKDEKFLAQIHDREDRLLLSYTQSTMARQVPEPNDREVEAFFERIKDRVHPGQFMTVETLWYLDRQAVDQAKQSLEQGTAFEELQTQADLTPKQKEAQPISVAGEGGFWPPLWAAEPNGVVGPLLGFKDQGLSWRLVKVVEKTEGRTPTLDGNFKNRLKSALKAQRIKEALAKRQRELLDKYPHRIYEDRLTFFDPRNVP